MTTIQLMALQTMPLVTGHIKYNLAATSRSRKSRLAQELGNAEFTWVSEDFLTQENVEAWSEMPLYLHESDENWQGFLQANIDKALAKGLSFRPLRETIQSTLNWRKTINDELKAGISAEREAELLRKWKEQ